jgi:multiple sugar transport system permease protein
LIEGLGQKNEEMTNSRREMTSMLKRALEFLDQHVRLLFPFPAVLIMVGLFLYPLFELFRAGMSRWMLTAPDSSGFIWFANFAQAFLRDIHFWKAVWLTVYLAFGSVLFQLILGFGLALLLNREFKGESIIRMLLLLPIIATPVAMSLTWNMMMNPMMGVLNYFVSLVGLGPLGWASDRVTVIPSLILVEVWHWTPFMMLVLLAGLRNLPKDPYEAAVMDGASRVQIFFKITLPLMQPYIVLVVILRLIQELRVFDPIFVISGGGPMRSSETLNLMVYREAFRSLNYGYACALGVVVLLLILAVSIVVFRYRERGWRY